MSHKEAWNTIESDLISRADVFEIIDKAFSQPMSDGVTLYADICLMLNALPTHANSRSTHERDLISRADAIEAVREVVIDNDAVEALKALPSADRPTEDYSDLPDIPRAYYEKIVSNMSHEINMLKQQLEDRPMVHSERPAEWIRKEKEYNDCDGYRAYYWYECSKCGAKPPKNEWKNEWHSPYCPSCGAFMKGGAK